MLALEKTVKKFKNEDFPYQLNNNDMKSISYVLEVIQKQKPLVETI